MMQRLQRGFAALALVALPGGVLPVRDNDNDDTDGKVPDLQITVGVTKAQNSLREFTIRVANVGPTWSDNTDVTIWTEPASAGPRLEKVFVENLSPFGKEKENQNTPSAYEIPYTLAAPCSGHKVTIHASLTPAKDWEKNEEAIKANNVIPRDGHDGVVCAGPDYPEAQPRSNLAPSGPNVRVIEPAGSTKPISPSNLEPSGLNTGNRKPIPVVGTTPSKGEILETALESVMPERTRRGLHADPAPGTTPQWPAVVLDASVVQPHQLQWKHSGIFGCPVIGGPDGAPKVGFIYRDESGCDVNSISQLIVNFDLQWLREIERKSLSKAELLFVERVDPYWSQEPTCVGKVGLAPPNWAEIITRRDAPDSLMPTMMPFTPGAVGGRLPTGPGAPSRWDVTGEVGPASSAQNGPLIGFVMHGFDENPDAEEDRACVSEISAIKLKLEYTVLD
jgi:hypothetical protein